jgi:hypothetical protein
MNPTNYKIEITETLQRIIEVNADSLDEAIAEIKKQYKEEEIVLDDRDCIETIINEFKVN